MRRNKKAPYGKIALGIGTALIAGLIVVAVIASMAVLTLVQGWLKDLPDYSSQTAFDVTQPTRIYSADGVLLARLYLQDRESVAMSQIATDLADALVAVEDERFYQHVGVDPVGILRAAVTNTNSNASTPQGASTITQQLIRNTILIDERTDITLKRKVREAFLALEIEKKFSKQQVLEMYLNTVYLGEGAYGAQSAARIYFSKNASELTLAESATIAGLAQAPSALDPYTNPKGALARRNIVLEQMLDNKYITQAEYEAAVAVPLVLKRNNEPTEGIYAAPYFVSEVKRQLQQQFPQSVVFGGGLTVYTTLDTRLQGYAEQSAHATLSTPQDPEVALVSIDPQNGYVKALVGGRDYSQSKFNLATQALRQPGSSFKTFVLVTALEQGMPPTFEIDSSSPATFAVTPTEWVVNNSEGGGSGMMSLASATAGSVNTVFARVAMALGIKNVAATAKKMGVTTPIPEYPAIALGAAGVTPLEMASAYGTLATGGIHYAPTMITKVTDRTGATVFEAKPTGNRVVTPEIARATTDLLSGVIDYGTGTRADINRPAAGKTGTSEQSRDVWFVGYTPQLVTSVWVGYPTERTIYVNGTVAYGGSVSAPIWAAYMKLALADQPVLDFPSAGTPAYDASKFNIPVTVGSLTPDMIEYVWSDLPIGTIISQRNVNGKIIVTVSSGPQPTIPSVPTSGTGGSGPTTPTP
ncbi:MAG: PBP1A family penicillin-binding protein [Coriobacteriia bacterium]|nr:PBP1A family penicillin-binding protein [Coriobacteriia bacterium]